MPKKQASKPREWFEDLFPVWRSFFDNISPRTTRSEVAAAIRYLGLKRGQSFLDCPCGIGRISIPLAERGIKVTGVDITRSYLDELRENARARDLLITLQEGDMRKITFKEQFDTAGNLWTSLGYFKTDAEDLEVLKRIYRALKPGGRFLLHLINRDWIIRYFSKEGWEKTPTAKYFERRRFDLATSRNCSKTTFYQGSRRFHTDINIRMYSCHELIAIFERLGYVDIQAYGGFHGETVTMDCRNMWIVGTKPKKRSR